MMTSHRPKRRRHTASQRAAEPRAAAHNPVEAERRLHAWHLAAVTALLVAHPLVPGEGAAIRGDGIPLVMLWLAVAIMLLLGRVSQKQVRVRLSAAEWTMGGLLVWHTISALWAVQTATPRPAINMLWQWGGYGLLYWLVRQVITGPREIRATVAVMIAVAVGIAGYGLYQRQVELPELRRALEADKTAALEEAGLNVDPDSREAELFFQRARSREPFATFALTNSLAAFLAPWFVLTAVIGLQLGASFRRPGAWAIWGVWAIPGLCLALTQSRAAYLAVAFGAGVVAWQQRRRLLRFGWRLPVAAAMIIAALITAGIAWRGVDRQIIVEAGKSLSYRFDYWQGALGILREQPWLGCGPGNFQYAYPAHMPLEASEEVADPHNFFFEVAASSGIPAGLALLAFLLIVYWRTLTGTKQTVSEFTAGTDGDSARLVPVPWAAIAGCAAGWVLAYPLGLLSSTSVLPVVFMIGAPLTAFALLVLVPWIRHGNMKASTLALCGVGVMLVDLTASGGIGYPGVAASLWMLAAMALTQAENERGLRTSEGETATAANANLPADTQPLSGLAVADAVTRTLPGWASWVALGTLLCGIVACYQTAYNPVLSARVWLARADAALTVDTGRAEQALVEATKADPWAFEPWLQLVAICEVRWYTSRDERHLDDLEQAMTEAVRRSPNRAATYFVLAETAQRVAERTGDAQWRDRGLQYYREAVERAPTSARYWAAFAMALAAGDDQKAVEAAREALRLHRLTPHEDRKLPPELVELLERITMDTPSAKAGRPVDG